MGLDNNLKKVLILGSGPIVIGQAAEFDYSGTQACKSIKEEGIETILVNSNPATIMTDLNIADKVYIEPLDTDVIENIIKKERPNGILAGFGGQTALNIAMDLKNNGVLEKYDVRLLGVNSESIKRAEDREEFRNLMVEIKEPIPNSIIAITMEECMEFVEKHGLPSIIRPAYTLGGTGGGIANTIEEYIEICNLGLKSSPINQILVEQSVAGWKEIEYEVVRDKKDNCIIICNMENIDPVGVHTGDSIVVAPSQTLTDKQYQMLRNSALKIIRSLKIEGGCNIQFALDPNTDNYIVIEVNPRVSRSSALASKAAGYPIAKIASKIAIGYSLDELKNYVTQNSSACFEPALDYVVVKMPKWPFDKFSTANRKLGTKMKATGEVMAIDRNFESAFLKAITCLEGKIIGLTLENSDEITDNELIEKIKMQDDERIFAIGEALKRGFGIHYIHELTKIDKWFLNKINNIVNVEKKLESKNVDNEMIAGASTLGFTDDNISKLSNIDVSQIERVKRLKNIYPVYKMVDTCSGEFEAKTPYYYSCYEKEDENILSDKKKIIVIGSGPIRIGQGVEFDYCCVHGSWAINNLGYESIMVNNNPETVSTDFDTSDKLYFESLCIDDVMNIIRKEKPEGVILQFGGQTSINLAEKLSKRGVNILGTKFYSIDLAEDRDKFRNLLEKLNIKTPTGKAVTTIEDAYNVSRELGYPVIVRPSYVIGGRAMEVIYDDKSLEKYMREAVSLGKEHTIIVDKYVKGTEIEVDAICDGENILMPGIMEHIERTGVHSGDSITVYPYITLKEDVVEKLVKNTKKICKELKIVGLVNIQYVFDGKDVYVIEVNPRASRTVPILSKVTGVPMVDIAVRTMVGEKITDMGYEDGLMINNSMYAVKIPVFSNEKLEDVDTYLGPEMKSTGEVLGIDYDLNKAIYKGFKGTGINIPVKGSMYVSFKDVDKVEGSMVVKEYYNLGYKIYGSIGTCHAMRSAGIKCDVLDPDKLLKEIQEGKINIVIDTPTKGNNSESDGFKIRRKTVEYKVPIFTCIDTAKIFLKAINIEKNKNNIEYRDLKEYFKK